MWGNVAVTQAYLTLSEVLGHMDILLNDGRVREVEENGVVRFFGRRDEVQDDQDAGLDAPRR